MIETPLPEARSFHVRERFVARIGALPFDRMQHLRGPTTVAYCEELRILDRQLLAARSAASAVLHAAISETKDTADRRRLIELRRRVFNGRGRIQKSALALLPQEGAALLAVLGVDSLCREKATSLDSLRRSHSEELNQTRERLQAMATDPHFREGLMLSSVSLFANLNRYPADRPSRAGSRQSQVERGILRYFTRASAKATPFGTFCTVIPGLLRSSHGVSGLALGFVGDLSERRRFVRLNKRLFRILWPRLRMRPAVRRVLTISLNSTIQDAAANDLVFLSSIDLNETVHRIANRGVPALLLALLQDRQCPFEELIRQLCAVATGDASVEAVEQFVERLLEIGFLQLSNPVMDQDPNWDLKLCTFLECVEDDQAKAVTHSLKLLRQLAERYERDGDQLPQLAPAMRAAIQGALEAVGDATAGRHVALPTFTDMSADATFWVCRTPGLDDAFRHFSDFVLMAQSISEERIEHATMRSFFDQRFGQSGDSVPLLTFYEEYFRLHMKARMEHLQRSRRGENTAQLGYSLDNPFGLDIVSEIRRRQHAIHSLLRRRQAETPGVEEITISRAELEAAIGELEQRSPINSVTCFCQLVGRAGDDSSVRIVMKDTGFAPGFGRYFARFLYMFSRDFQKEVLDQNCSTGAGWMAEIAGDGAFNANLHPKLVPQAIAYPSAEGTSSDETLAIRDLDVRPDGNDRHALAVFHRPTGERVFPLDLGFMHPSTRPPLFQLLVLLSPYSTSPAALTAAGFAEAVDSIAPGDTAMVRGQTVAYRPRYTYENRVVISRRRWRMNQDAFPRRSADENEADYFYRVSEWRREHGIPEQVYATVSPPVSRKRAAFHGADHEGPSSALLHTDPDAADDTVVADGDGPGGHVASSATRAERAGRTRWSADLRKPQFIDFGSPLLVQLFERLPRGLEKYSVALYETLPDVTALPESAGAKYSYELVLQADTWPQQRGCNAAPNA